MTDLNTIPLNKLVPFADNVRKTGTGDGIDELAASIAAHGLLQSLVVRKAGRGKYAVVAGNRRLAALKALAESGIIPSGYEVPCRLIDESADATEIGLAENIVRMPMHPADQFEAFRDLIDAGASVADVAARFGVAEVAVARRLRLGRLSPVILDAYRRGEIGLEEAQAFAITDDRDAQERVWSDLPEWSRYPRKIRRALTDGEALVTNKRVRCVGLEAYEAAGGAVRRDLFDEAEITILDEELLDRLVGERLGRVAETVRAEGWAWVEIVPDLDHGCLAKLSKHYPDYVPLSDEDDAELDRLNGEYDTLAGEAESNPENADLAGRLADINDAIDALVQRTRAYPDEVKAIAGAIVTLTWQGHVDVRRGLVRPGDEPAVPKGKLGGDPDAAPTVVLPARLTETLTAEKTAIIRHVLAGNTDVALAAVVHSLALQLLYRPSGNRSCLQIAARETALDRFLPEDGSTRTTALCESQRDGWNKRLPENPDDLWSWCLEQTRDDLVDLLAFCAAGTVDAIQRKQDLPETGRLIHGDVLARSLSIDMAAWYRPTATGFFGRISAASIRAALREARGADGATAWAKLKKAELAALAEREIASSNWLPLPMRLDEDGSAAADRDDAPLLANAAE